MKERRPPSLRPHGEALLEEWFAAAPVGFGVLDADLRYVRVNERLAALDRLPAAEHPGRTLREVLGDRAAPVEPMLRRALGGESAIGVEVLSEGRRYRVSAFPLHADDALAGLGIVVVETTDDRRTSDLLRISEERLRLALEGTQTGTWEWEPGSGTIRWSPSVGPLFGLEPGASPPRLEDYQAMIHPEDRAGLQEAVDAAVQHGQDYQREFRALWPDGSVRWLASRAHAVRDEHGEVVLVVGLLSDADERRRRELSSEFLAEASLVLSHSLDVGATLQRLAELAVPALADWCAVATGAPGEALTNIAVAHHDPARLRWALELQTRYPPDPDAPHGPPHVIRTGRSELLEDIPDEVLEAGARDAEHLRLIRELGLRSAMVVPLVARGRTLGAMTFISSEPGRRYDAEDLALAEELGRRAGLALDNAELHRSEREAHDRVQQLQAITDIGLNHLDLDTLLVELLRRVAELTESPQAAVLLLDDDRVALRVRASFGLSDEARRGTLVPLGAGVAGRVAASGRPLIVDDTREVEVHSPHLRASARSVVAVPLLEEGKAVGVLRLGSPNTSAFGEHDVELLQLVADRAVRAISHARLYEEARNAALTLQRSLLPAALPHRPGVSAAARYLPGQDGTEVGGDWYDLIELPGGELAIVVGDIVGRGLRAAALMGQLRNALRAYAYETADPADILERLDRLVEGLGHVSFATVGVCVVDVERRVLRAAGAGHLQPLLVAGGEAAFVAVPPGPPVGLALGSRAAHEQPLPTGALLLVYTDGLVERRDAGLEERLERLRRVAEKAPAEPDALLERVVGDLTGNEPHADDIAVLAVSFS